MTPYNKALAVIKAEHDIVDVVFKYIDRMTDVCDTDPLEGIAAEFVEEVNPLVHECIDRLWR